MTLALCICPTVIELIWSGTATLMVASRRAWPVWVSTLCASTWTRLGSAHGGMAYVVVGSRTLAVRAVASTARRTYHVGVISISPTGRGDGSGSELRSGLGHL